MARVFEAARVLGEPARRAFLERETGGSAELRAEVERLLALHEAESGVLDEDHSSVAPTLALEAVEATDPETAGRLPAAIGPYRVERRIGRGGMGQVFLAVREDTDFEKRVAIKVLRPGLDDADLLRRFRSERRILAQLEHPNIATLIDGGATEDGRPYVVMEYVEGRDVMRYARARALGLEQRVELFVKICHAVEHAHRSLIVHRDLKPTNILVTAAGEPKLLDFGIAKLLDSESADHSVVHTGTGMALFTPEYASPEQVRGHAITTATDVYSLGAMLYELLTDVRAHALETRRPAEVERVVCGTTPPAPSAAPGSPMPARWLRRLAGDLDNITLVALRKEPERRYGSVAELSDDLRRFLEGLPVRARPDTLGYRASKFVRRNAWWVGVAALIFVLLGVFAVVMAVQARSIARQRDIARREGRISREVSDFLVDLFERSNPHESLGEEVLARTLLDQGARRIAQELNSGPLVRAELMETMGLAYLALGLAEDGRPLLAGALDLREEHGSAAESARSRGYLGMLERFAGNYARAEELMRASMSELDAIEPGGEAAAEVKRSLASLLDELGRGPEALELAQQAYASYAAHHEPPHEEIAQALVARANIHENLGQFDAAEELYSEALEMQRELFGPDHPSVARTHSALGRLYKGLGDVDGALARLEEALRIDLAVFGEDHPEVIDDYFAQAQLVEMTGDFQRAEELFRRILAHDRERFGEAHPYVALDLSSVASTLSSQGRCDEAMALFEQALAIQSEVLPQDAPEIATTLSNMGACLRRARRFDEARAYLEDALVIRERVYPPDHPTVLTARNMVAITLSDQGRFDQAEVIQREILEARREKLGAHPHVAGSLFSLALCRRQLGDMQGAVELLEESVALYEQTVGPDHVDLARALTGLGQTLLILGRLEDAEPRLRRGVEIRAAGLPADHLELAEARRHLGTCLAQLGRGAEVESLFEAALAAYLSQLGPEHLETANARRDFASAYEALGRDADARRVRGGG